MKISRRRRANAAAPAAGARLTGLRLVGGATGSFVCNGYRLTVTGDTDVVAGLTQRAQRRGNR
jgi:hypothetical protein